MSALIKSFIELIYPSGVACCACGEEAITDERGLCAACALGIRPAEETKPPEGLTGFTAGLDYTDEVASAIHRFKYADGYYLAEFFAQFIVIPPEWGIDAIVPVPLHRRRLRKRGYNQSALLAEAIAAGLENAQVREDILRRTRHTRTQTALGARARKQNLRGAFQASPEASGLRVLLVDDVRTTGATLSECARALHNAGAQAVYACTAAARERN